MFGLAAKQVLVAEGKGNYINLQYLLSHIRGAPNIAWVYWSLISIFALCFCTGAFLEWLKRKQ